MGSDRVAPGYQLPRFHFNPRSPCGERRTALIVAPMLPVFQSTLPVWGATGGEDQKSLGKHISIHAPRVGSDGQLQAGQLPVKAFQSTLPVWGATALLLVPLGGLPFQSTLPVWGATKIFTSRTKFKEISIHAPRVGSDDRPPHLHHLPRDFNPRSPCGERHRRISLGKGTRKFQSTLPVWGATHQQSQKTQGRNISIHAPRVGSDLSDISANSGTGKFQSTLPVWGATKGAGFEMLQSADFNPRSPCGERHGERRRNIVARKFQSTLPVWGATLCFSMRTIVGGISIHAPRVGSDASSSGFMLLPPYFNPRSPCGERRQGKAETRGTIKFQSTLPVWGATRRTGWG